MTDKAIPSFRLIHVCPQTDFMSAGTWMTEEEAEKLNQRIRKSTKSSQKIIADSAAAAEHLWSD